MRICTPQDDGSVRHLFDCPEFVPLTFIMRTAQAAGFGVYLSAWRLEIDGAHVCYPFRTIEDRCAYYRANRALAWRCGFETTKLAA